MTDAELKALEHAYAVACVEHAFIHRVAAEARKRVTDSSRALMEARAKMKDRK
jgi:hypothetical protein